MQLSSIKLTNFLNHSEAAVDFNKVNIFSGHNGAGKTAILQAILFALTGISRRDPVQWGAKSCAVNLVSNDLEITRKETRSGSKELSLWKKGGDFEGTTTEKQSQLMRLFGMTETQVEAVLETGRFLELKDDDRKDVIFRALDIRVTAEHLLGWLGKQQPDIDWNKIVGREIESGLNPDADNQKVFVERRRAAKRRLSDLSAEMDRFLQLPNVDIRRKHNAQALLADLEKNLAELHQRKGEASHLPRITVEFEAVKSELNKPDNSDRIRGLTYDAEVLQEQLDGLNAEKEQLLEKVSTERGTIAGIGAFQDLGDSCDRCGQRVTKTLAKRLASEHSKRVKLHESLLKDATGKLAEVNKEAGEISNKIGALKQEIRDLESGNYKGDRKTLERRYDELLAEKKRLSEIVVTPAEIDALELRISNGRSLLANIELVEQSEKRKAEIEEAVAETQLEIEASDWLEKAFSPKGVKADLLRSAIAKVEDLANEFLSPLGFGEFRIQTTDGSREVFRVMVGEKPDVSFSRAQRHAINFVIQAVLSQLTGLKILAVDDVDMFVGDTKSLVNRIIFNNIAKFDTVLIFKADAEKPKPVPVDGVSQFWLNGKLEEVKA